MFDFVRIYKTTIVLEDADMPVNSMDETNESRDQIVPTVNL